MKSKRGQKSFMVGIALILVFFLVMITTFATIPIFKETLDNIRNGNSLNCVGTPDFNSTDFNDDSDFEKLVKRPTCFVTGLTMVYFVFSVLIAGVVWVGANWRKVR